MSGTVSVYAVFADDAEARRVGRTLIEERHAACVNILGAAHSIYRWQGRIEEAEEVAAIFKTSEGQASELIRRLTELHSYDVPAVTVWPIAQVPEIYRRWILENSGR